MLLRVEHMMQYNRTKMQNTGFSNDSINSTSAQATAMLNLNSTVAMFYRIWEWLIMVLVFPLWPVAMSFDIITLIIFLKSPLGTTKTTRMYYLVIAAADMSVLIIKDFLHGIGAYGIYAAGIDKLIPGGLFRWQQESQIGCDIVGFVWFNSEIFLNYVYVVLDVERFIALYFPLKAKSVIRKRNMVIVLVTLGLYCLGININWFWTYAPVRNPYAVRGYVCAGTGANAAYILTITTMLVINDYVLPTFLSLIFTVLIVIKIKTVLLHRKGVGTGGKLEQKGMSAKQREYFLTPLIISILHIVFYIPLAVFRLISNILSNVTVLNADVSYFLYGFGFDLYQLVMPVHIINFLVYYRRIPGFAPNARAAFLCRYGQIVAKKDDFD